jgi:Helix-turn-helix of insertion element transposase
MSNQPKVDELETLITPQQKKAAWLLVNNDISANVNGKKKTLEEIAAEVGVDVRTLYKWRHNDQNFIAYVNAISDISLYSFRQEADAMLKKLIRGGNNGLGSIKALQLYYQMIGKLVGKSEKTVVIDTKNDRLTDAQIREKLKELDDTLH